MKKILIFINSMQPAGGIERVVSNLANNWTNKYQVVLLVKDDADSFYNLDSRIQIETIYKPLVLNMHNRFSRIISLVKNIVVSHFSLKKILMSMDPDVIYTTSPINSLEIYLTGNGYSRRLIVSEHGSKLGYNRLYNLIKRFIYPKVKAISVPTTFDTELYVNEGLPAVFVPHLSTFKNQVKCNLQNKRILNIGRLTKDKQQMELLEIWFRIVSEKKNGDWLLILVGSGEEEKYLKQYIEVNNLDSTVSILEPDKNVGMFFESSSIFAFTSRFEGFGMVLLEAMSFGIPCISYNCPSGPRDIIDNGINGYLIENRDIEEYKNKLLQLMEDETLRRQFGEASFIKANNWENDKILKKWDELFESIES